MRKLFSGKGFAKPRQMFLKFSRDFEFRPRGGRVWEGIRAGFCFWNGVKLKIHNSKNCASVHHIDRCPNLKGCTLGIHLGHFRLGYECLGAFVRALARASWGEEVSSPRVGTTLSDYRECSALAIPTLRFSIYLLWCRFRFEVQHFNSGQALVL